MHMQSLRRKRLGLLALSGLLGLGGCAQLPISGPLEAVKSSKHYRTETLFAAPAMAWPSNQWWLVYGDKQLNVLIAEALRDSPDMAMAAARLRRAEAMALSAGAVEMPQVGASAAVNEQKLSYNHLIPKGAVPEGWQDYGQATLNFAWEIDFWGRNRAILAAATSELEATRAEGAQARLTLTTVVTGAYADLAHLFAIRDLAAKTVEVRAKAVKLSAERFEHGLDTKSRARQADAGRASAEADVLLLDEQIGLQRNRLAALLGAGPDRGLKIEKPQINLSRSFGLPPRIALDLMGRRPDIVVARLQAEVQAHRIDQKQAEFYPNVNLTAFVGVQSLGLDMLAKGGSSIGSIGPAISLPIFTGGRLEGELKIFQAAHDEAIANYNRTVTQALHEVANVTVSQKALAAQIEKVEESVEAARDVHRVSSNRQEGGLSNYLEVLMAEDSLLAGMRALTSLQSRAFTLDVALIHALGGGYAAMRK